MILLYICLGMSAVFSLIKEFRKPQINRFLLLVDSLILLEALFLVDNIFIYF
ncbi:amino acid transporter [Bacillus thuringiensis]|uniref:Amino acid transporter n=1 Tax=Bacillus cereus TaxID=1396 RepID=A0A9X0MF50_BACCE|nr:amino acid transporter [Bacillus cereus]MBG9465043.1 amino acid transporter [Bacillus thuringiensis]